MANLRRRLNEKVKNFESDNNYRIIKDFIIQELDKKSCSKDGLLKKATKKIKLPKEDVEKVIKKILVGAINGKSGFSIYVMKIYKGHEYYRLKK